MKYWKIPLLLVAALASLSTHCIAAEQITLARNGKTSYVIAVGKDAIPAERTAAKELGSYLKRVTGAGFAVKSAADVSAKTSCIMVGQTAAVRKLLPEVKWASLGHDGIVIKAKGRNLILAGGRPRGTLYAVYTFLESNVGCRWWTSTEEYMPEKPTLTISAPNTTYVPALSYREAFYGDTDPDLAERLKDNPEAEGLAAHAAIDPLFAARLKTNGHMAPIPQEFGGHYSILGWCHTFASLMPPDKYFDKHPEWYGLKSGKRFATGASDWQLCLTNLDMRKELTRNVLETVSKNPEAGIISVSQNDGYGQCQCENCQAAAIREGSEAGPMIEMVNAVAEEVEKVYPGFLVETLAYHFTRKPPLTARPRHNVLIRLAGLENDQAQPADSAANSSYRNDIKSWSAISPNLFVWHYAANYGNNVQPHPNIFNIGPDLRFFTKNRAIGVFVEGMANPIGDFGRLRKWVIAHMLWNPSLDPAKLADEFCRGYYGPAGPHISAYLELAHGAVKRSEMRLSYGNDDTSFLSLDEMNEATRLWNKAEEAVSARPEMLARVRRDRLSFNAAWILNWARLKREAEETGKEFLGSADVTAAADEHMKNAEAVAMPMWIERQKKFGAPAVPANSEAWRTRFGIVPEETARLQLEIYADQPPGQSALPEELRSLRRDDYHIFRTDKEFLINNPELVDDPLASGSKALRLAQNWSTVQWRVRSHFSGRWRCFVRARCVMKDQAQIGPSGYLKPDQAFETGVFDAFLYPNGRYYLARENVAVEKVTDGAYHTYDLGVHDLKPGMHIWATIADSPSVKAVYVDRAYLVKELAP